MMMNARRVAVVAGAAMTLIVAACGGGVGGTDRGEPAQSAASATPGSAPTPPTYRILNEDELTAALLPLEAMPTGYSEDLSDDSNDQDKTFCDYEQPYKATTKVSKSYVKGSGLSSEIAGVTLRQYANVEQAGASFNAMANELETCHVDISDGQELSYALMNLPEVGERSLGVRIESQDVTVLQGFALVGPTLISVGAGGLIAVDADTVAELLVEQVEKYMEVAAG